MEEGREGRRGMAVSKLSSVVGEEIRLGLRVDLQRLMLDK